MNTRVVTANQPVEVAEELDALADSREVERVRAREAWQNGDCPLFLSFAERQAQHAS